MSPEEQARPCPRLLSAAPTATEICGALGLANCLIGRTRYCSHPPAAAHAPSIGALDDLNVEALLALNPELVLVSGTSRAISDRLARLSLRYESLPDDTLQDLFDSIARVGQLTGRPATAARLETALRADLDTVLARRGSRPAARVLILLAPLADPPLAPHAAGPGSFYDDLLRLAGCTNVAQKSTRMFAPLSLEFILQADPEVIVELVADPAARPRGDADARRVWALVGPLTAVRNDRVRTLIGSQYLILGPRIAITLADLCAAIDGDGRE